jgi:hypothetical protein
MDDLKAKRVEEEMERQKEVEHLKQEWREYLREIEHEKELADHKRQQYRRDLDCQTAYQETIKVGGGSVIKDILIHFFKNQDWLPLFHIYHSHPSVQSFLLVPVYSMHLTSSALQR